MASVVTANERYIEKRWTHEGVECVILKHPRGSHRNAYARIPDPARLPEEWDAETELEVHGGITYGLDEEGWVGFDTAHAGDVWPDLPDPFGLRHLEARSPYRTDWTMTKLEEETNRLAEQIVGRGRGRG